MKSRNEKSQSDGHRQAAPATGKPIPVVIVAAGLSRRMGTPKPLLGWNNRPMIAAVVETFLQAGAAPLYVVLGHEADKVRSVLTDFPVAFIDNLEYNTGEMLSSVQAGARALPSEATAFMVALADQPAVQVETVRQLIQTWRITQAPIIAPQYRDERGHPIVLSTRLVPELLALSPGQTLKDLVHRHQQQRVVVSVDDPGVVADLDTPAQYQQAVERSTDEAR